MRKIILMVPVSVNGVIEGPIPQPLCSYWDASGLNEEAA